MDSKYDVSLLQPLLRYRRKIVLVTLCAALVAFAVRTVSQTTYTASVAIAPAESDGSNVSEQLARFSGLASFAGINLHQGKSVSNFDRFLFLLESPELGQWQIDHRRILQILFPERWDWQRKTWKQPGIFARASSMISKALGERGWHPPDAFSVANEYDRKLAISKVAGESSASDETGMIRISYTDKNSARATYVLRSIISDDNEILRGSAAERASIQANYLRSKLQTVTVQDYRETLEKLLSEQEQILMLTNSHLPFAAAPVSDENIAPLQSPKRTGLFAVIGAIIGFCLAYFVAILAYHRSGGTTEEHFFEVPAKKKGFRPAAWISSLIRPSDLAS